MRRAGHRLGGNSREGGVETLTALAIFTLDGQFYSWKIGRDTTRERMIANLGNNYWPHEPDFDAMQRAAKSATFYVDPIRRSEAWCKAEDWIAAFGTPLAK